MADFKDHIVFWNGQKMPIVGLGTWQVFQIRYIPLRHLFCTGLIYSIVILRTQSTKEEIQGAINSALECGYRHFDCAYNYLNEDAIGEVFNEWITSGKVKREELFIVTKVRGSQVSLVLSQ